MSILQSPLLWRQASNALTQHGTQQTAWISVTVRLQSLVPSSPNKLRVAAAATALPSCNARPVVSTCKAAHIVSSTSSKMLLLGTAWHTYHSPQQCANIPSSSFSSCIALCAACTAC